MFSISEIIKVFYKNICFDAALKTLKYDIIHAQDQKCSFIS